MCKCNDIDRHALYLKCCLSINGACATPEHVLFDMGADPISFVNGEHGDDDSKYKLHTYKYKLHTYNTCKHII